MKYIKRCRKHLNFGTEKVKYLYFEEGIHGQFETISYGCGGGAISPCEELDFPTLVSKQKKLTNVFAFVRQGLL